MADDGRDGAVAVYHGQVPMVHSTGGRRGRQAVISDVGGGRQRHRRRAVIRDAGGGRGRGAVIRDAGGGRKLLCCFIFNIQT